MRLDPAHDNPCIYAAVKLPPFQETVQTQALTSPARGRAWGQPVSKQHVSEHAGTQLPAQGSRRRTFRYDSVSPLTRRATVAPHTHRPCLQAGQGQRVISRGYPWLSRAGAIQFFRFSRALQSSAHSPKRWKASLNSATAAGTGTRQSEGALRGGWTACSSRLQASPCSSVRFCAMAPECKRDRMSRRGLQAS